MPLFHQQSRHELRRAYVLAWKKSRAGERLTPLEAEIAYVIAGHPEYQALLESPEALLAAEFLPEGGAENPFLHLGLHLAVREQVSTDRPAGIARIHARLCVQLGSSHAAEHRMLEALGETLWEAEHSGTAPDEGAYLERLERLCTAPERVC